MVDILVVTPVFDISVRPHGIYHDCLRSCSHRTQGEKGTISKVSPEPVPRTKFPDAGHSEVKERFVNIGRSSKGNMLIVIHTEREESILIISSRKATTSERKVYEEGGP